MSDDLRLQALRGTNDPRLAAVDGWIDPRLAALLTEPRDVARNGSTDPRIAALRELADSVTELAPAPRQSGPSRSDLAALKDGAAMMIRAGNQVAAMALLWSAVAIDPTDLAAHRRIAATLAHGGDINGAADEYARYIEFMLPLGEVGRAALELDYGAKMLGGQPALREAAEKIVAAVRAIVPATNAAMLPANAPVASVAPVAPVASVAPVAAPIAPAAPPIARIAGPIAPTAPIVLVAPVAQPAPAPVVSAAPATLPWASPNAAPAPSVAPAIRITVPSVSEVTPQPAPRLLPKVPFRFCVHADGDRHWMQLEGGTGDLMPAALRVVDPNENVIETRLCIPLAPGDKGHAPIVDHTARGVAWVVVGIPNDIVAAIDAGKPSRYGFQAKVGDDWLSLDLIDTGCRLGRTHATQAVS
jgi:hypothetical protein